jgi:hypothetical protein
MFCLWVYGMLYRVHGDEKLLLPKTLRVTMRLVVAIILAVLPETHDHLGAESFMFVVMSLFAFVLGWETVGGLERNAKIFEPWHNRHPPREEAVDEES